jgi:alkaline phosphatase
MLRLRADILIALVLASVAALASGASSADAGARNLILFIADGWGNNQIEACDKYVGTPAIYESWSRHWMATWDVTTRTDNLGIGYDPSRAWSDFAYVAAAATDSASSATAMYTGHKTDSGKISVGPGDGERLMTIGEIGARIGKVYGAITTVPVSHATPAAMYAHNSSRANTYAIADEGFWGDPNTTGTPETDKRYRGGWGGTVNTPSVIIGAGHPDWDDGYVSHAMRDKLAAESGQPGAWTLVERIAGRTDAGARLLATAKTPRAPTLTAKTPRAPRTTTKLVGLFGGKDGNFEYRLADGSGANPENPTLAECALAALNVLNCDPDGFVLMIEGGAIDWANHANNMNAMIGEMIDYNNAVAAVAAWIEDPTNGAGWDNTLVIICGDHECGYLSAGPGVMPNVPLGEVSDHTLRLEKPIADKGRRASWDDTNNDNHIDEGERVYWAYNSGGHTNSLIPVFAKGAGSELLADYDLHSDPVRGKYLDNTTLFEVMWLAMMRGGRLETSDQ